MSTEVKKKVSVSYLFTQQVVVNFVVVALLIVLGALLVFKVYAEDYTQYTALGFIAAVYFSFIVFLPAGTLFASRAEFAKGKVAVAESEKTGAGGAHSKSSCGDGALGRPIGRGVHGGRICGRLRPWLDALAGRRDADRDAVRRPLRVRRAGSNIFRDIEGYGGDRSVPREAGRRRRPPISGRAT